MNAVAGPFLCWRLARKADTVSILHERGSCVRSDRQTPRLLEDR